MRFKLFNASVAVFISILFSCGKSSENPLKNEGFTSCPQNAACSYGYSDYADIVNGQLSSGNKRVFIAVFSGGPYHYQTLCSVIVKPNPIPHNR